VINERVIGQRTIDDPLVVQIGELEERISGQEKRNDRPV
jgi:hypothetical protein